MERDVLSPILKKYLEPDFKESGDIPDLFLLRDRMRYWVESGFR